MNNLPIGELVEYSSLLDGLDSIFIVIILSPACLMVIDLIYIECCLLL